jgi:hypothetical protein
MAEELKQQLQQAAVEARTGQQKTAAA